MEQKISKMNAYFDQQITACEQRNMELQADERIDEANFEKVKANVYGIFRTVFGVALQYCKNNSQAVEHFFRLRIQQIPLSWATSYKEAQQHQDAIKMHIEEIKLGVIEEIKEHFASIWEEA